MALKSMRDVAKRRGYKVRMDRTVKLMHMYHYKGMDVATWHLDPPPEKNPGTRKWDRVRVKWEMMADPKDDHGQRQTRPSEEDHSVGA
jgi:hypothetical protein